jgi:hypothetical protein
MTTGKPQLFATLALLAAAIVYNVWAFTRPAAKPAVSRGPAPVDALPTLPVTAPTLDPLTIAAPRDVAMDTALEWRLDPFTNAYEQKPGAAVATGEAPPPPEPDVTDASILLGGDLQLAIVNGRIVRVGDTIGGSTVVEIQPRAVVLDGGPRGRRAVALRTPGIPRDAISKVTR